MQSRNHAAIAKTTLLIIRFLILPQAVQSGQSMPMCLSNGPLAPFFTSIPQAEPGVTLDNDLPYSQKPTSPSLGAPPSQSSLS